MIYFNKLIDICINRQESQKVVNNYFVGTKNYEKVEILTNFSFFIFIQNLLSDKSLWTTGSIYLVDGGKSI